MLVSGGQILAIDKVNTGNTILGDGVQKPLNVNTDLIATTSSVSSVSSTLEHQIDSVSSNFQNYYKKEETSGAQQIQDAFDNFKTTETIVSAGSDIVDVISAKLDEKTVIYTIKVTPGEINIAGASGVSAKYDDGTWTIGLSADFLSANALEDYYKKSETSAAKEISAALTALSSWADETFLKEHQSLDDYYKKSQTSGAEEISNALLLKQDVSAMSAYATSAWVDENYQKKGEYVTSANNSLAGEQLVLKDNEWQILKETDWTDKISAASAVAVTSAKNYTDTKLEDYYKKNETSSKEELEEEFAKYQLKGDYLSANALDDLSGKWESVYNTTVTASGNWNEASAFAANSAKFVTSAGVDFNQNLAYFLKKQEENVVWSGVDLSNLGKMYNISSMTPELISAGISADEQNNQFYVLSAAKPGEVAVPSISGENGVSAHYDDKENTYVIGLSSSPAYASFTATTTADDGVYTPATYSESYNVGNGVTLEDNTISVGPGLWHVTIYAKVTNTEVSPNYYDTVLTCNSIKNIVQFDNSYIHTEYINLDADVVSNDSLTIDVKLEDVPENSTVVIEQLQLHRIVTGSVVNEGGNTYTPGDGISIDNYQINAQAGSGIFIDANNKLSIKLGKGLAFSADGDVFAIETDNAVNEVVETVETLKKELDGKLTTNMNVSDAQYIIDPLAGTTKSNIAAATLFTVPLQHNITTATQISFFTTDTLPQNAEYPFIFGLYEYNFDYFVTADDPDHNNISARSQTKWVADTGPIWWDTLDEYRHTLAVNKGKFTFTFNNVASVETSIVTGLDGTEYVNEFAPCMRSDRAYYLVLFARGKGNISNRLLGDNGYANGINETDPQISFRLESEEIVPYIYPDETTATMNAAWYSNIRENNLNISLSGIPYWTTAYRHTNDVNGIGRPYVMIRNPRL